RLRRRSCTSDEASTAPMRPTLLRPPGSDGPATGGDRAPSRGRPRRPDNAGRPDPARSGLPVCVGSPPPTRSIPCGGGLGRARVTVTAMLTRSVPPQEPHRGRPDTRQASDAPCCNGHLESMCSGPIGLVLSPPVPREGGPRPLRTPVLPTMLVVTAKGGDHDDDHTRAQARRGRD